ncbi:hypothetical protein D3877_06165 [Azospirillum cavernae]|uniref:Uncharacterized protein n=1 Tax=Azospirillum cavernae TaxID=2320860 RepID=A0A418W2G6_9PROT|nr:hypothetical protein D3877_06165 [Azospirillum cavernae]
MNGCLDKALLTRPAPSVPLLPLTHATPARWLPGILDQDGGTLAVHHCTTLGADLVYFFYGRPDYSPKDADESHDRNDPAHAPVYMVLSRDLIAQAANIYPFDTGGHKLYEDHVGGDPAWRNYTLDLGSDSARRVVECFYESNFDYFDYNPKDSVALAGDPPEMTAYHALITNHVEHDDDGRRSAIEVSLAAPVRLMGTLQAIIVPNTVLANPAMRDAINALSCNQLVYSLPGRYSWRGFREKMRDQIRGFLDSKGCFDAL